MKDNETESLARLAQSQLLSDTFDLINSINKKIKDLHRRLIQKYNLTIPQYCVIRNLGKFGALQLKDLAEKCQLSRPTMTGVIDTMENHGLVTRESLPKDRRGLLIMLTKKGTDLYDSLPMQGNILGNCCEALKPEEIQQANQLLAKIFENFEQRPNNGQ